MFNALLQGKEQGVNLFTSIPSYHMELYRYVKWKSESGYEKEDGEKEEIY